MPGKAVELGELFAPAQAVWLDPANHPDMGPLGEPGLVVVDGGNPVAIKGHQWRPAGAPPADAVHDSDVVRMTTALYEAPYQIAERSKKGVEDELSACDEDSGLPANLWRAPEGELGDVLGKSPELFSSTAEISVGVYDNMTVAYNALGQRLYTLMGMLPEGVKLDPASARMQDVPGIQDVTPNPYVEMKHRIYTPHKILTFVGHGIHEHHDAHVQNLPVITKYTRTVAYLLNVGLLAAPFGFGEVTPNLGDILDKDELRQFDGVQPHSVRYPTRLLAAAEDGYMGGVGFGKVHSELSGALSYADRLMRDNIVDMPARLHGPYADVRSRVDPPTPEKTNHPGRLELCVKDTGAQRIQTLIAYGELSAAVIRQLEVAAAAGERGVAELHNEFPRLFGTTADDQEFAERQLPTAHANSLQLAYYGNDARVTNGLGEQDVPLKEQMRELIRFATRDGQPLLEGVMPTLRHSLMTTPEVEQVMLSQRATDEPPSLSGYYATGAGSPAQWMIQHAAVLPKRGRSQKDILRMGTQDRMQTCSAYITDLCTNAEPSRVS